MSIGKNIKLYRENNKMTQKELAKKLDIEPSTLSKYENGLLEPNIQVLKTISEIFGISLNELVKDENELLDFSKINLLEILKEQKNMKLKGNLYHNIQIAFTYNTNHIEGSTLTEEQTRYIFETNTIFLENNTIANVNDIVETTNHFRLIDYIIEVAEENLSEKIIKECHKILKSGTSDANKEWFKVGEYKKLPNTVGELKTTSPKDVQKDINKLLEWYNSLSKVTINDIIEFHARFEKIHPFQDGNGRVGRIIAFKECLKNNIVPFIILDKEKFFYYRGLYQYQTNKEKGYLIDTCLNAQDQFKNMIKKYII